MQKVRAKLNNYLCPVSMWVRFFHSIKYLKKGFAQLDHGRLVRCGRDARGPNFILSYTKIVRAAE